MKRKPPTKNADVEGADVGGAKKKSRATRKSGNSQPEGHQEGTST
jgi:hypothetical protein